MPPVIDLLVDHVSSPYPFIVAVRSAIAIRTVNHTCSLEKHTKWEMFSGIMPLLLKHIYIVGILFGIFLPLF